MFKIFLLLALIACASSIPVPSENTEDSKPATSNLDSEPSDLESAEFGWGFKKFWPYYYYPKFAYPAPVIYKSVVIPAPVVYKVVAVPQPPIYKTIAVPQPPIFKTVAVSQPVVYKTVVEPAIVPEAPTKQVTVTVDAQV